MFEIPFMNVTGTASSRGPVPLDVTARLAARVRPTSARKDCLLPLPAPLVALFPGGALQRGTVVGVDPGGCTGGATTLAFSILAAVSRSSWCAAVGTVHPGVLCLEELGIDLEHLAIVPVPRLSPWPEVTAMLLDGLDAVLLRLPWPARPQVARRLVARARERQALLVVLGPPAWWPEPPDLRLEITDARWQGVGEGHGYLRARHVVVRASGRRIAARPVEVPLWLPAASGAIESATPMETPLQKRIKKQ